MIGAAGFTFAVALRCLPDGQSAGKDAVLSRG